MTVPVTRAAEGLPRRAFTVADVERMVEVGLIPPDERLEIIGGEIVPMSPKGNRHEQIKVALTLHWGRLCREAPMFTSIRGRGVMRGWARARLAERLEPTHAPREFGFALDGLEAI